MINQLRIALGKVLTGLASSVSPDSSQDDDFHRDIYGRRIPDADVFFYPQKIKGVPVFDIESVMKHYHKEIKQLRNYVPIGDHQKASDGRDLFTTMYLDVLYRFAEYIHLIPASEDHHHRGPGGLLIHSIQTAQLALTYAETKKYKKSGFVDIDKEMAIRARYATWVAGLMHDTGKILRDLHIDAVEQIDAKGKTVPAKGVATWAPHLQTMIEWAKANNVATYAVSYVRHRKHNAHNIDSSHLLPYILGRGDAMKYLVEAPGENLYSEVCKVLTGIDSDSYLSRAVKEGDAHSTMKDMSVYHDIMTGVKNMSVGSRVVVLMKMSKATWNWNTPGGEGWIIGGNTYMRWPNAIQSIIKESIKQNLAVPHDAMALVNLMENHGLIKRHDEKHRAIKFTKGQFSEEDVAEVADGKKTVPWEELIQVTWDGHLFGDDPKPSNCKGILYLAETKEYISVDRSGLTRFIIQSAQTEQTDAIELAAPDEPKSLPAHAPAPAATPTPSPSAKAPKRNSKTKTPAKQDANQEAEAPEENAQKKPSKETEPVIESVAIDTSNLDTEPGTPEQSKGILFTRNKKQANSTSDESGDTGQAPIETVQLPVAIIDLQAKGAAFWFHDGSVYLEVDQSKGIGQAELKAIKAQHLDTNQGAVSALARTITVDGRNFMAAKLKPATGNALTLAGVVVNAAQQGSAPAQSAPPETRTVNTAQLEPDAVEVARQAEVIESSAQSKTNTLSVSPATQAVVEAAPVEAADLAPARQEPYLSVQDYGFDDGVEPTLQDVMDFDAAYQESLNMEPAFQMPPESESDNQPELDFHSAQHAYDKQKNAPAKGTLGWMLHNSGIDISEGQIRFKKEDLDAHLQNAGLKLTRSKLLKLLRDAGCTAKSEEDSNILIEQPALHVSLWNNDNEQN